MDMSVAFESGVKASLPNGVITFDKYHIVKLLNEAVDEVRRQEQRGNPGLKNTRFLWLQKGDNLSASAKERVVGLSKAFPDLRGPTLPGHFGLPSHRGKLGATAAKKLQEAAAAQGK